MAGFSFWNFGFSLSEVFQLIAGVGNRINNYHSVNENHF